ncbi:MAG TPA: hypothetical protein VEB21_17570, partial [Terriglobales bacterium]|nr:hypothetical protein [Terriglobales bacterium]
GRYKDPYLTVLRVDTAAGEPMGMFFAFAIHGTVAGEDNQLWSVEASGHVEAAVEEKFDSPVVVGFMQHGGGDASPAGVDDLFARMESIGELAADAIYNLWQQTPTSTAPITLESVSRTVDTRRDMISVEREHGTLTYAPFSPSPEFEPDNIVYDDQGRIITPIDEFNTANGGAFCGAASPPLPVASIGADVFPYASCLEVGTVADFIGAFFMVTDIEKPLPESLQAKTGASRIGPLSILTPSGEVVQDDVLMAFFPGEATATYTEQFRRRAASELGMDHTIPVGYAQDHQGYLLIPEDWLQGGYEPNINLWGPLHAEHIMEGVLSAAGEVLLTEAVEPYDPAANLSPVYAEVALPTVAPDLTPNAGTALSELPSYFLIPVEGLSAASAPPSSVRRVQDVVQFMWEGGDPGVDLPVVYLEVQADDGSWDRVLTASGRPVSSPMHDMLLATTPNPLAPATAEQRHVWWVAWQAVPHFYDRAGLPLGSYRFHIEGQRYTGGAQTWPWPSEPYQLDSPTFEVVPAEITLAIEGEKLIGSIDAPATGFRLIDVEGSSRGSNPVRNATITISFPDGSSQQVTPEASIVNRRSEWTLGANALVGASAVEVVDGYGNRGNLQID